jgi:hypothetical protein
MSDPTLTGPAGRAWLITKESDVLAHQASLASWIVNVPGAHPFWSYWMVAVCHLRDIPGVKPAIKQYPSAEYEFLIASIDPERCPDPTTEQALAEGLPLLSPIDVAEQFHGVKDQDAFRVCEAAIRAIVNGQVSPDQDYRPIWKTLIRETVKHFREGRHPLN